MPDVDHGKLEADMNRVIKKMRPEWEKIVSAVLVTLVEDFGNRTADDLGAQSKGVSPSEAKWRFDPFSEASRAWISRHGAEAIKTIQATNLADVRAVILKGKEENLLMPQIGQKIKDFYADRSSYKAMRVARTEVSAAAGFGQREAAKQSGIVKTKKWVSSRDDRVRDSHQDMDGEERGLDEVYSNGLMFPGDPSGLPEETIMCRCVEQYMSREPEIPEEEVPIRLEKPTGERWVESLSEDEAGAVDIWTGRGYRDIRSYQSTGVDGETIIRLTKNLESALDKSGLYKGIAWRGLQNLDDTMYNQIVKAKIIRWEALTSATKDRGTAATFAKGQSVIFRIETKTAVDISKFSTVTSVEREIIMRKATSYIVKSRRMATLTVPQIGRRQILQIMLQEA